MTRFAVTFDYPSSFARNAAEVVVRAVEPAPLPGGLPGLLALQAHLEDGARPVWEPRAPVRRAHAAGGSSPGAFCGQVLTPSHPGPVAKAR